MKRRMYFLFPDTDQTRVAVNDLAGLDVAPQHMHTIARADIDITGLPTATNPQRHDALAQIENGLWRGNLLVFVLATVGLIAAAAAGAVVWMLVAAVVMAVTLTGGAWFAMSIPPTHIDEFRQALQHGEILLMVDVSRDCVDEIQALMEVRHPEAVVGGNGWLPEIRGI